MDSDLLSFCEDYVGVFLILINRIDNDFLLDLEADKAEELERLEHTGYDDAVKQKAIDDINSSYHKKLFDYIRDNIALSDSEFFNEVVATLNDFLTGDDDLALELNMKIPGEGKSLKMNDYYDNYLIALTYCMKNELNNQNQVKDGVNEEQ